MWTPLSSEIINKPGVKSPQFPLRIWLGMRNSNLQWILWDFQHCFLGVFCKVVLPLVIRTASSKMDVIGWILKEISTTGGVMNQLVSRGRVRSESEKKRKAVLRKYISRVILSESITPPFPQPTTTWNRANPLTKSYLAEASVSHRFILCLIALAYVALLLRAYQR